MHIVPGMFRTIARRVALTALATALACTHPTPSCPTVPPAAVAVAPAPAAAASGYDLPPANVREVLDAPPLPRPSLSPTGDTILLVAWVDYPPIAQVAEPYLRLAGVRVEPRTRRKHDTAGGYGVAPCAASFTLVDVATRRETALALPAGGCADAVTWAADGTRFAFRNTTHDAVELWLGDVARGETRRLGTARLNPMLGSSLQWLADQRTLLVKLVPADAGPPPAPSVVAIGPSIQETDGAAGASSTYELRDTLTSKHDEALFEYYATSQLALIDAASGAATPIGAPAVIASVAAAPDGDHLLVSTIRRPYSYVTTYERFARDVEVWDRRGAVVARVAQLPAAERVPIHGVPTGPREHEWRPTEPATLVWAEALDGGDWSVQAPARDRVMLQRAPFAAPPVELVRLAQRLEALHWSERGPSLLVEYDENRHWERTFVFDVDAPGATPSLLWDLSSDERYRAPGAPLYRALPSGAWVMRAAGDAIFLSGAGSAPEGARPFLDRLDLKTRASTRLFRSARDGYEYVLDLAAADGGALLTWRQSPTEPPNVMVRTLGAAIAGAPAGEAAVASSAQPVTRIADPTPAVRAIKKQLVRYQRGDGVDLAFTLYTPPGYQPGTRVPAILYAYPLDYASAATAGQTSGSDQLFTRLRDYQLLLLSGYAIIDAAFPIVGDPATAYDTYLTQLVANAQAAVDKAVDLGVVDRERIGVTGHSHGALMTVNLLAHSDLFRAGAATSGSYNKTLTPFGFQSERRTVWQGREVYLQASPFFFVDQLTEPLLIVHGKEDANPGTTPLQASKLYEAIRGNGGTARLVMLPHEPHWYAAKESNQQLAYEELRWFDRYVKDAAPRPAAPPAPGPGPGGAAARTPSPPGRR